MGAYILKQLALAVPTLLLLTFVAFSLTTAARGDPAEIALRQGGNDPTPEQIAALIAFAASSEAGYLTGAPLRVDGGSHV